MAVAIGYRGDGVTRRRGGAVVATLFVHVLLLLLILWGRGPSPDPVSPSAGLRVFDVVPPPLPPDVVPPPPPVPPQPVRPTLRDGGSPDRARPAPSVSFDAPARIADLMAEPLPAQAPQGQIPLPGLAAAAPSSMGPGAGSGDGEGGRGRGDGTGSGAGRAELAKALWISIPSPRQFEAHWPERARRNRVSGRVMLSCIVPRPGPPRRCRVVSEYPRNLGFGASAMRLSRLFRIQPVTRGAEVQNLPVIVPITFDVPIEIRLPVPAN
ncbi:hypothetical protein GCM10022268_29120 [Sphingomonas cynarae]|uniref:TonB C-terminal domain-containing protein n=1 Tax=Sphingomonas cynarae TaxID=930197 RepID=A0ABP7EJH7_9SPHN